MRSAFPERESAIEAKMRAFVLRLGCLFLKWPPTSGSSGWPDRIVLCPGGRVFFVEVKRPGGKVTPLQAHRHEQLRSLGHTVLVLGDTPEWTDALRDEIMNV